MPPQCPTCHRINPAQARFCYHDGVPLGGGGFGGPIRAGSQPFLSPFVFPSGRACKNFDDLVRGIEDEWQVARDMLRQGYFVGFLRNLGRADLAHAAGEAARAPDADRALDEFLARLPGERTPPMLHVSPRDVNLGQIESQRPRPFVLTIANQGAGLLTGTARSEAPWLALGDAPGVAEKHFSCRGDFTLPVQVKLANLRAGVKTQEGQITISAGNQSVSIVVRANRSVVPFGLGKLAGATTPRKLAELARDNPREAAPLFEAGQVARWYENNGWTYPVQGPPAAGLGAVQQYFEALGLAKPPRVRITHNRLDLTSAPGGCVEEFVQVETSEKRAVFARALSDVDWLEVVGVKYLPNSARIHVRVPCAPLLPGQRLGGKLTVISNGNQRFDVEVGLQITGKIPLVTPQPPALSGQKSSHQPPPVRRGSAPLVEVVEAPIASARMLEALPVEEAEPVLEAVPYRPAAPPPPALAAVPILQPVTPPPPPSNYRTEPPPARGIAAGPSQPPPMPLPEAPPPNRLLLHSIGPILVLLVLLGTVIHDFLLKEEDDSGPDLLDQTPRLALKFLEGEPPADQIRVPADIMSFGVAVEDLDVRGKGKRLMYDDKGFGRTNNVCLKIDRQEYLFGYPIVVFEDGLPKQSPKPIGAWMKKAEPLGTTNGRKRIGTRSVWRIAGPPPGSLGIEVTQTVELVPGDQSQLLDTVLIRYTIVNRDSRPHDVGIRFLLDTFIGANDGVPFTIPGRGGLCSTRERFEGEAVPNYIQAVENDNLTNPGTVAQVQLRVGGGLEAPSLVLLGGYPDKPLQDPPLNHRLAAGWVTGWEVPFINIREIEKLRRPPDSAVTIYWDVKRLESEGKREVGFTYGLGDLNATNDGRLALTVAGDAVRGSEFSLTALRRDPVAGERLKLILPPDSGLEIVGGASEQPVPPVEAGAARPISTATWRLRGKRKGRFDVTVESSEGPRQVKKIQILPPRPRILD